MARKHRTAEQFKSKAAFKHGDKYDLSLVEYVDFKTPVTVVCNKHMSPFTVTPWKLLSGGAGCPECGTEGRKESQRYTYEDFIRKATQVHDGLYTYIETPYENTYSQMQIVCKEHGVFEQRANNHLNGRGCRKCMDCGFNITKPAKLYILVADGMLKVGVTNSDPRNRARRVKAGSGKIFKVAATWNYELGRDALDVEMAVLSRLRSEFKNPSPYFEGATECFVGADLEYVSEIISKYV